MTPPVLGKKAIEERVRRGLEQDERWKIIVRKNNWLCPYCGKIGARELRMDEDIEAKIAAHFQEGCRRWREFEARPLATEKLRLRAKLIVFELRVARWIREDGRFRIATDGGKWLCPYCARDTVVATPEGGLERAPDWGSAPEEHPLVVGIARHLLECRDFARGDDRLRSIEELDSRRALSSRSRKRARIRERIEREPEFRLAGPDGKWICPFCASGSAIPVPKARVPGDDFVDAVLGHLLLCKDYLSLGEKPRPAAARKRPNG